MIDCKCVQCWHEWEDEASHYEQDVSGECVSLTFRPVCPKCGSVNEVVRYYMYSLTTSYYYGDDESRHTYTMDRSSGYWEEDD